MPRGQGRASGVGKRLGRGVSGGRGLGGGTARGPGGECVCPKCGYRLVHQLGVPCNRQKCPKCGETMTRV